LKSLLSSTFHGGGNTGSGVDTFIYFFLGLFPDVKMYSDFADGKEMKGVGPDTTVTEYILKTSIPTIMMISFCQLALVVRFGRCMELLLMQCQQPQRSLRQRIWILR